MPTPLTTLFVDPQPVAARLVHEPVTVGVPFPRGAIAAADRLCLHDADGQVVPLDATVLERWSDHSIRWALLDFQIVGAAASHGPYQVSAGGAAAPRPGGPIDVTERDDGLVVTTGAACFTLGRGTTVPFTRVSAPDGRPLLGPDSGIHITFADGRTRRVVMHQLAVRHRGALRAVVVLQGRAGGRRQGLDVFVELQFFAGASAVRMAVTLRNPRRARHRGGRWELGDRGSIHLESAALHLSYPAGVNHYEVSPELDAPAERCDPPIEVYQDSSGGPEWRHITHVNRHGIVPQRFRGYRLRIAGQVREGLRATPAVTARHAAGGVGIACPQFWQNCPMALEARAEALVLQTFPRQFADRHELQGGEQKTHRCTLTFGADDAAADARVWGRSPAVVRLPPAWYALSEAHPFVSPA